ncbi:Hypothetical predicted protein [Prunus dulcis]|uniref:Uncharacterized protein n=1 Tax=Prunus dulcis TaxID=3755 RepID=A0A5E4GMH0_PRUDU|nr:hypothetical protein L3X38_002999 [Prunus dulcis]VVA40856.1 Hypothetical predicted protein [Prunus dulcis]
MEIPYNLTAIQGQRIGREAIGNPNDEVSSERSISGSAESGNEINNLSCDEVVVEGRETLNERRDEEEGRRWQRECRTRGRVGDAVTASPPTTFCEGVMRKCLNFGAREFRVLFITLQGLSTVQPGRTN